MSEKPNMILDSKYKKAQYHMYDDRILVISDNNEYYIELPQNDGAFCFYDMYYVKENIHVTAITRGCYDIRYILDENNFSLTAKQLSK